MDRKESASQTSKMQESITLGTVFYGLSLKCSLKYFIFLRFSLKHLAKKNQLLQPF